MLKSGEGEYVFCRCGCGEPTARVKLPPGSKLEEKFFGYKLGHKVDLKKIWAERDIINQRRAAVLINAMEAMGVTFAKINAKKEGS